MTVHSTSWLIRRSLRDPGSNTVERLLSLLLVTTICTFLLLAAFATGGGISSHADRLSRITPTFEYPSDAKLGAGLYMVDPGAQTDRRWNGHPIDRQLVVAVGAKAIQGGLPGVPTVPSEGEYRASPQLTHLIKTDSVVRRLFDDLEYVGEISNEGLDAPGSLKAIVGISRHTGLLVRVTGYGGQVDPLETDSALTFWVISMVSATIIISCGASLFFVCRLDLKRRMTRAANLRILGFSRAHAQLILISETGVTASFGGILGLAAFILAMRRFSSIPGTGISFYPGDMVLTWWQYVSALGIVVGTSCLASALRSKKRRQPKGTDTSSTHELRSPKGGVAILSCSLMYLFLSPVLIAIFGERVAYGIWVGCGLACFGLAWCSRWIVFRLARQLMKRAKRADTLVGLAFCTSLNATSCRVGGLVGVLLVLTLGSFSFMNILSGNATTDWSNYIARNPTIPVVADDILGTLDLATVQDRLRRPDVVQVRMTKLGDERIPVVYADCRSLGNVLGGKLPECDGSPQWLQGHAIASHKESPPKHLALSPGVVIDLPGVERSAFVGEVPDFLDGGLIVPTRLAPKVEVLTASRFLFLSGGRTLSRDLASVSGVSSTIQFDLGRLQRLDPDVKPYKAQISVLAAGLIAALAIGALALTMAVFTESTERQQRLVNLRTLGGSKRDLIATHCIALGFPTLTLGLIATALGTLICVSLKRFDDRAQIPYQMISGCAAGVCLVAVVLSLVTLRDIADGRAARTRL